MDGGGIAGLILDFNFYRLSAGEDNWWSQKCGLLLFFRLPQGGRVIQIHSIERDFLRILRDYQLQLAHILSRDSSRVFTGAGDYRDSDYQSAHSGAVIVFGRVSGGFGVRRMQR